MISLSLYSFSFYKIYIHLIFFFLCNFLLFLVGTFGPFATRKNSILILISIEIILLAGINNLISFSIYLDDLIGQSCSFFILGIAACEAAIGLGLLVVNYRHRAIISIDIFSILKN